MERELFKSTYVYLLDRSRPVALASGRGDQHRRPEVQHSLELHQLRPQAVEVCTHSVVDEVLLHPRVTSLFHWTFMPIYAHATSDTNLFWFLLCVNYLVSSNPTFLSAFPFSFHLMSSSFLFYIVFIIYQGSRNIRFLKPLTNSLIDSLIYSLTQSLVHAYLTTNIFSTLDWMASI